MDEPDYAAVFVAMPNPCVVVSKDFEIVAVNPAYSEATGKQPDDLIGKQLFEVFPDQDPDVHGEKNVSASLRRVFETGQPHTMALQRYDVPLDDEPGSFEERWWALINSPISGPGGEIEWVLIRAADVTEFVRRYGDGGRPSDEEPIAAQALEAEVFERARELQRLNVELSEANTREREIAVALQRAMLLTPDLEKHSDIAVRYLPAIEDMNVCGDWYDVIDLSGDRFTVGVGDVVGHGLEAAAVMGMLRSVLNAAIRALERPSHALEVLGLYARSMEGALNTTAAQAMVDPSSGLIIYSNSGHPPPVLVDRHGSSELLDQALDPPLGARPQHVPCSQAGHPYQSGDTLVLYTDGLIERRGEDIDAGLHRLRESLARHSTESPRQIADAVLDDLGVAGGTNDDISLTIVRL
ncbi:MULTISPECIES: SpoIIE family protein phosphatase [Glycomyces]|uniref:PAS domain S-box-containing protein n=2 Tax=Glycomyces TaxID=58113 RepID=A0A9X3ST40_9ACTN|nr:SpoIIE family protein phosphatase [Glycomyces lechevalierae]MDA1383790.1 SpoIIE family protein phosphatase [Glycomyces lechevalierae]MDR7341217.1 PAS domain S-box-containing protein [Glycomyces lechevalierae]